MRRYSLLGSMWVLLFCFACGQQTADQRMEDANSNSFPDTVAQPGSGVIAEDSTLQKIEEVVLKALGDKLEEMAFSKDTIKVPAGSLVKIEFINEGKEQSMIHNFVVTDSGMYKAVALAGEKAGASGNYIPPNSKLLAASPLALPGQTVKIEFEAPLNPTTYDFVCTYPGHYEKMHGKLIVK